MRRPAAVLLSCLGLLLAVAGPADAGKPQPLEPLAFSSATSTPSADEPGSCDVYLMWSLATAGPKGYSFIRYDVAGSSDPSADWDTNLLRTYTQPEGYLPTPLPNGSTWYVNVRSTYVKVKGKFSEASSPWGEAYRVDVAC